MSFRDFSEVDFCNICGGIAESPTQIGPFTCCSAQCEKLAEVRIEEEKNHEDHDLPDLQ